MKRALTALVAFSLLAAAAALQSRYDGQAGYFRSRQVSVDLPNARTLKIISLGHHDALAELIFLWSIQFYSTSYYSNRWDSLVPVFDAITGLSPDNPDFYLTGSIMMAREAGKVHDALKILERAAEHFQSDYIYEYWAGFFAVTMLKDFKLAAQYQERAAKRPNALAGIMNLYAHYIYMQDDLDKAWELFSELKRTTPHESIKKSADLHLYDIQFQRDQKAFTAIVERFRQRHDGRLPASFDELVNKGYLSAPPLDYKGDLYGYDARSGKLIPNQKSGWKKYS